MGLASPTARYYSDSRLYFFDPSSYHGRVVRSVELPKGARGRGITQMTNGNLMVESSQGTSFFSEAGDPLKVKLLQCKQNTHTQCFALKNGKILLMTSRLWFWDLTTGHHERVELTQVKEGSLDLRHVAELGNGNLMLISRDYMKDQGRILIADRGGKVLREYEGAVFEAPTKLRDGRLLVSSQRGELMYFSAADGQLEKCESLAGVTDHPNEFWKFQTTQTYPWTNTFSINSGDQQTSLRFTFLNDGVYVSSKDYSYLPLFDGAILVSNGKDGFQPAIAPVSYLNKLYRVKARECAR